MQKKIYSNYCCWH